MVINELFGGSALDCELEQIRHKLRYEGSVKINEAARAEGRRDRLRPALLLVGLSAACGLYLLALYGGLMYLVRSW